MKNKTNRRLLITGLVAIVALFATFGFAHEAQAAHPQVSDDGQVCIVNRPEWSTNVNESNAMTLKEAIYVANQGIGCTRMIVLDSDVDLLEPMVVTRSSLLITGAGIVDDGANFQGDGNTPNLGTEQHTINASRMVGGDCAIVINASGDANTSQPTLANIKLMDVLASAVTPNETGDTNVAEPTVADDTGTMRKGVCINGKTNVLDNVDILNIAGDGFFFSSTSDGNVIMPNCSANGVGGYGVRDMTSTLTQLNAVKPTSGTLGELDDGLYAIPDIETADNFTVSSQIVGGLLSSEKDARIKVTSIALRGNVNDGQYIIEGALVKGAGEEDVDCSNSLEVEPEMQQIAIFNYEDQNNAKVIRFVGLAGVDYTYGVLRNKPGHFKLQLDKDPTEGHPEFADLNIIILVPLNAEYQIVGKASRPITLQQNATTDCIGNVNGGGDNIFGFEGLGAWNRFNSVQECQVDLGGQAQEIDPTWDSDMDLILDYIEMSIRRVVVNGETRWIFRPEAVSCTCEDTLSCWYMTDTDHDGIIDSYESPNLNYTDLYYAWNEGSGGCDNVTVMCPQGITPYTGGNITDKAWDVTELVLDSDRYPSDKKDPDVQDPDSDDDGLDDGVENRNRLFHLGVKSYYYYLDGMNNITYLDSNNEPVECDLNDARLGGTIGQGQSEPYSVGVAWSLFIAGGKYGAKIDEPIFFEMGTDYSDAEFLESARLMAMSCRNGTVAGPQNFNRIVDPGETNPRDADTDDDCVCDGPGGFLRDGCQLIDKDSSADLHPQATPQTSDHENCADMHGGQNIETRKDLWYADACPNTEFPTRVCVRKCIAGEITSNMAYNPVAREFMDIVWEDEAETTVLSSSLAMDERGVPAVFSVTTTKTLSDGTTKEVPDIELISNVCGDIDGDGIPNCVERWDDSSCYDQFADRKWLDPYNPDTDGDGYSDGKGDATENLSTCNVDVCPFPSTTSGDDKYTDLNPQYTCDPLNAYDATTFAGATDILAHYLDRDCDGLSDAEEDKNIDGRIDLLPGLENRLTTESHPVDRDTDDDGLSDWFEVSGEYGGYRTNPADPDTDDDGISDPRERAMCRNISSNCVEDDYKGISVTVGGGDGSCGTVSGDVIYTTFDKKDTDPLNRDTDGDGLFDGLELAGNTNNIDEVTWTRDLNDLGIAVFLSRESNRDAVSDPTQPDSDLDDVCDGPGLNNECGYPGTTGHVEDAVRDEDGKIIAEYHGIMDYNSSNPCSVDSDGDIKQDGDPSEQCPLVNISTCLASERATGPDTDGDGVPDDRELVLGTDLHNPDTDGDGLTDGEEDRNGDGYARRHEGETDPNVRDTDGDGLDDGIEVTYGTDGTVADTDGDCIPDGVEDANQDGHWTPNETRADVADSDGDGLIDGRGPDGTGEDLNCNGIVDTDENGRPTETNPRTADSDMDGILDYDEMFTGGQWNINNIDRATSGRGGCTLAPTATTSGADGLIAMMMGLMLAGIARVRLSLRSRKKRK